MVRSFPVFLIVSLASAAHAEGDAEKLYQEGQAAYDAKRYDDAIKAWDQSYALSKFPVLVFNLAQAHRLGGHCTKAVVAYKRFLSLDPASELRPDAEQFLRELEPCADAPKPDPIPDKGPGGKPNRFEDHGGGKRRAGLIVGGTGVAMFATGLYFGSRASSLATEVQEACTMGCEWSTLEGKDASGRRAETFQYVFYALGGAAIVGGTVLYLRGRSDKRIVVEAPSKGGGAVVGISGRF